MMGYSYMALNLINGLLVIRPSAILEAIMLAIMYLTCTHQKLSPPCRAVVMVSQVSAPLKLA